MIPVAKPRLGTDEYDAAVEVLKSGMYTSGAINAKFENEFAAYVNTDYSVSCNSGTAAIHMALLALGIGPGDEVIVPALSFFATVSPILMVGAEPVFCDVDNNGLIDPMKIERLITQKTKALIPVHLYGHPCNMELIMNLARTYNLKVIEDCAQAHGAKIKDQIVGSFGDVGCFSFFATKNITTIEGGMITTYDSEVARMCRLYRSHGMIDRDNHVVLGYNYRMNELSAAIGRIQLQKLDLFNIVRRENTKYIYEHIFPEPLKSNRGLGYNPVESGYYHVYFWAPVFSNTATQMDSFKKFLKSRDVGFRCRYTAPMYKQPIFKNKYTHIECPKAERLCQRVIGLPNHQGMKKKDMENLVSILEEFFKK